MHLHYAPNKKLPAFQEVIMINSPLVRERERETHRDSKAQCTLTL